MKIIIYILLCFQLMLVSCEKTLLNPDYENNPVDNFECLWKNYDLYYGEFLVRNIQWDSIYSIYRPLVHENTTQTELYQIFKEMVRHFHDDHVFIDPTVSGFPRIESGRSDSMKIQTDFSSQVVDKNYLTSVEQYSEHLWYGKLPGNIGYIRMDVFKDNPDFIGRAFDKILKELEATKGLVFDIRRLEGGDDRLAKYIAGRFAGENRLYMESRKRNGASHDNFEDAVQWFVCPEGKYQYRKPVMLLTGRFTASAGETFTWAMVENKTITLVGDTTLGAFSDLMTKELPNGWLHTIPVGDYRNSAGKNLEGKGIPPDVFVGNTKEEILAGTDRTLEKAMELLK